MPGSPAARLGDKVVGTDYHFVQFQTPAGPLIQCLPFVFQAGLAGGCCPTVRIGGKPAATKDTSATISPPHVPPPSAIFPKPPQNSGTVLMGSVTVRIGGKPAARVGDTVLTCSDPVPAPNGKIVAGHQSVRIG
ncbi:PAAR domain-containing protein [Streptomyces sp. NBC_00096]|uniref:PAAR domain-containing protein n=1 Tax=Streptomyces sp. NBC_00096 TaxID=2975650 RepID=UPI00324612CA